MDKNALVKTLVAGSAAGVAVGSAQYLSTDTVDVASLVVAVLTAVLAYLKKSPQE